MDQASIIFFHLEEQPWWLTAKWLCITAYHGTHFTGLQEYAIILALLYWMNEWIYLRDFHFYNSKCEEKTRVWHCNGVRDGDGRMTKRRPRVSAIQLSHPPPPALLKKIIICILILHVSSIYVMFQANSVSAKWSRQDFNISFVV